MSKFFESKNPLLKESAMEKSMSKTDGGFIGYADRMSIAGAVNKTFMLFGIMMITTVVSYMNPSMINLMVGAFGGLGVLLYAMWKPTSAPFTAPLYAYLASFVMSMFGSTMPFLHDNGMMGIGISVVIIGVAAMNLLLDFDSFEKGEAAGAPKYMEWMCAMGLMVTLIWLYVEFLRLLSKLQRD